MNRSIGSIYNLRSVQQVVIVLLLLGSGEDCKKKVINRTTQFKLDNFYCCTKNLSSLLYTSVVPLFLMFTFYCGRRREERKRKRKRIRKNLDDNKTGLEKNSYKIFVFVDSGHSGKYLVLFFALVVKIVKATTQTIRAIWMNIDRQY